MIVSGRKSLGDAALGALEAELLNEKVEALGRAGRAAQDALKALCDGDPDMREALLNAAAGKVWSFVVQRELCGLANADAVIADLQVPPEVVARLGIAPRKPPL